MNSCPPPGIWARNLIVWCHMPLQSELWRHFDTMVIKHYRQTALYQIHTSSPLTSHISSSPWLSHASLPFFLSHLVHLVAADTEHIIITEVLRSIWYTHLWEYSSCKRKSPVRLTKCFKIHGKFSSLVMDLEWQSAMFVITGHEMLLSSGAPICFISADTRSNLQF